MKTTLLLPLCLMFPINAMEMQTNGAHARLLTEASEHQIKKSNRSFTKKATVTAIVALLTGAGLFSNLATAINAFEPTHYQALPYMPVLPLNNATCTYSHEHTEKWDGCCIGKIYIPKEFCNCGSEFCNVTLQTCQEKDPFKKEVVTSSGFALAAQLATGLAGTAGIWCID